MDASITFYDCNSLLFCFWAYNIIIIIILFQATRPIKHTKQLTPIRYTIYMNDDAGNRIIQ